MKTTYKVTGMTCNGCVNTVKGLLSSVQGVHSAAVSLDPSEAVIESDASISLAIMNEALAAKGHYALSEKEPAEDHSLHKIEETALEKNAETYKPLIVVVGFILLATAISQYNRGSFHAMDAMRVFMGSFFIAFSFFKILDVKGFAYSYMSYDIIAKRWLGWGFIYPFVELILGIAYLTSFNPTITNAATLAVMSVSSIGVIQSVLKKETIKCACLGTGFNLPMSTVTIVEDVTMVVMAAAMLVLN